MTAAAYLSLVVQYCLRQHLRVTVDRINNAYDKDTWERMAAIKSQILRIWDTATVGVRVCCIKFSQRVIMAQTTGPEADPRVRSSRNYPHS